jgi:hypothetical protein
MRRIFGLALLTLPLLAGAARADGPGGPGGVFSWFPYKVEAGANAYLRVYSYDKCCTAGCRGPWYLYWPLEAHFITPANPHFPFWPSPQTLPPKAAANGAPAVPPPQQEKPGEGKPAQPDQGPDIKPTSYQLGYRPGYPLPAAPLYQGPAPSYWYDR